MIKKRKEKEGFEYDKNLHLKSDDEIREIVTEKYKDAKKLNTISVSTSGSYSVIISDFYNSRVIIERDMQGIKGTVIFWKGVKVWCNRIMKNNAYHGKSAFAKIIE